MKKLKLYLTVFFFCLLSNITNGQIIAYQCNETYPTDVHGKKFEVVKDDVCSNLDNLLTEQPDKKLSKVEISELAKQCGLYEKTKINSHLRLREGDISYWYEQQYNNSQLSEIDLRLEFVSRRVVLLSADKKDILIETQGDLSHAAQKIQAKMLKEKKSYFEYLEKNNN